MQRHGHDPVHMFISAVCPPGICKTFSQKRRQMKATAVFEFMNPMPRLPFERKRGNRKPPRPVIILQLALAAFVQQAVRRPATTRATSLRQRGAFLQTVCAHLFIRRQQRLSAARADFRSQKIQDGRQDFHHDAIIRFSFPTKRRRWRTVPLPRQANPVSHASSLSRKRKLCHIQTEPPMKSESLLCRPSASDVPR